MQGAGRFLKIYANSIIKKQKVQQFFYNILGKRVAKLQNVVLTRKNKKNWRNCLTKCLICGKFLSTLVAKACNRISNVVHIFNWTVEILQKKKQDLSYKNGGL